MIRFQSKEQRYYKGENDLSTPAPVDILPVREGVIPVDEWKPEIADNVMRYSGKCIIVPFDELISGMHNPERNKFYVSWKDSYVKKFSLIAHYINYFIKYYDDGELIMNYLCCKNFIDSKKINPNRKSFIRFMYEHFVTPTMYAKVKTFVEDNYRIDLSQNKDPGKQYSESLEFTNDHAKILMLISTFIKMMIPVVMHYISTCKGKPEAKNLNLYFKPLFDVTEKVENVCLYAKLYNTISMKVVYSEKKNRPIWDKYEAESIDAISYTEELLDKNLLVDNIFKYDFTRNIISFNSVILKTQLRYRCVKNFGITMQEINEEKDSDGLSYLDKHEMNAVKMDESKVLLSEVNIKHTIKTLKRKLHVDISKDEIEYYARYHKVSNIGKNIVFYAYAKHFGSFVDLKNVNLKLYLKLMIMLKRRLQFLGYKWLPLIISANSEGYIGNRTIHNTKEVDEVTATDIYQNLIHEKYETLSDMGRADLIRSPINTIANTQFSIVDYDVPESLGEVLEIDIKELGNEMLMFENQI